MEAWDRRGYALQRFPESPLIVVEVVVFGVEEVAGGLPRKLGMLEVDEGRNRAGKASPVVGFIVVVKDGALEEAAVLDADTKEYEVLMAGLGGDSLVRGESAKGTPFYISLHAHLKQPRCYGCAPSSVHQE